MFYKRIIVILTCCLMFFSAFFGVIFVYGPIMPLMFIWPKLYRRTVEIIASVWQSFLVAIIEKIYGIEMVFTGEGVNRHEKTVMLLNHRTRLDWFYFFSYVFHSSILNRNKIALKAALKWVPGIGWAMQADNYIFLDRRWDTDQDHISKILRYHVDLNSKPNILFFPEGTDFTENTLSKSNQYADKHSLSRFQYVLHPRTKGFCFFVNTLRKVDGIHAVHDVTVGYPYNITQGEVELLKGNVPKKVNFHLKRYPIDELPTDDQELSQWIKDRWIEKEERLRLFYSEKDASKRSFSSTTCPNLSNRSFILWLSLIIWTIFTFAVFLLLFYCSWARFYTIMISILYITCGFIFGGIDKVEMLIYESFFKPSWLWGSRQLDAGDATNPYDKYLR